MVKATSVFLFLIGLCLFGCQSVIAEPTVEPLCTELGIVEQHVVTETARGYDYPYAIYLPPCYEADADKAYPILYLLPGRGGNPNSWFAANANEVVDDMILNGKIPPFIIVGTQEISSDPLADTIYNDLMPHIENNYRVKAERPFQAVAGGSLGSVGAYRLTFQYPDQFASAGMFGGGLIQGEEARVEDWLAGMMTKDQIRIFLNTGEQDSFMLQRAEAMIEMLDLYQIEHTELFTPGEHTYDYWVSNLPAYFEWLAQDWE